MPRSLPKVGLALLVCTLAGCNWPNMGHWAERREGDVPLPEPEPFVRIIQGQEITDLSQLPLAVGSTTQPAEVSQLDVTRVDLLNFTGAPLSTVSLMLTRLIGQNVVASAQAAARPVTVYLKDVTARSAIETICRLNDLWYREDGPIIRLLTREEYGQELVIKSDEQTRLYYLRNASAPGVADMIASLMPDQVEYVRAGDESSFGHVGTDGDDPMTNTRAQSGYTGGGVNRTGIVDPRYDDYSAGTPRGVSRSAYAYSASDVANNFQKGLAVGQVSELARNSEARRTGVVSADSLTGRVGVRAPVTLSVFLRNNCIGVRTVDAAAQAEIGKIIANLDTPTRQVLLEVKVLRVALGDNFESVFGMTYKNGSDNIFSVKWLDGADISGSTISFSFLNKHVEATLKLLKTDNRLHAVATPMLLCANNAPAEFFSGVTRMITVNYDFETRYGENNQAVDIARPIVEERDIGTEVRIKPSINADGTVTLRFLLEIGTVNPSSANIFQVNSQGQVIALPIDTVDNERAESIVVAKHGQAVVMGGLISESIAKNHERVPVIGDIPGIGTFFGKQVDKTQRTETVMIIVPHIIATPCDGGSVSRGLLNNNSTHPLADMERKGLTSYNPERQRIEEVDRSPLLPICPPAVVPPADAPGKVIQPRP